MKLHCLVLSQEAQVTSNKPTVVIICWCLLVCRLRPKLCVCVSGLKAFFHQLLFRPTPTFHAYDSFFFHLRHSCKSNAWVCTFTCVNLARFSTSHAKKIHSISSHLFQSSSKFHPNTIHLIPKWRPIYYSFISM